MSWNTICPLNDILPNSGRAALIDDEQVAIFRITQGDSEQIFAISNYDPFSEANVLSRGIVGSLQDKLVVASPIYKQHFDLVTGQCLEDSTVKLDTWAVKLDGAMVQVDVKETATA